MIINNTDYTIRQDSNYNHTIDTYEDLIKELFIKEIVDYYYEQEDVPISCDKERAVNVLTDYFIHEFDNNINEDLFNALYLYMEVNGE